MITCEAARNTRAETRTPTRVNSLDCLDGTVEGPIEIDPRVPLIYVPIAGDDPEHPTTLMFDFEDLDALVEARARLVEAYPTVLRAVV